MRIFLILIILMLSYSCDRHGKKITSEKNGKMIALEYETSFRHSTIYRLDTLDIILKKFNDSSFVYCSKGNHDSSYSELKIDLKKEQAFYDNYNTHFVDRKLVSFLNEKPYFIYRVLIYYGIDTEQLLFWTEDYGVILRKSLHWRSYVTYEYLNDEEKNRIIRILCNSAMGDESFFNLKDWEENYRLKK